MDECVRSDSGEVILELLRRAGEEREGPIVDGHDVPYAQEASGVGGFEGAHDDLVADRQQGEVGTVDLTYKAHVAEDGGVARMVELEPALELQDVPDGLASVHDCPVLFGYARRVEGVNHGDPDPADLGGAALLHWHPVLDALSLHVGEDLEIRHHQRPGLLRDRYGVGEVIEVAVSDKHGIELPDLLQILWGLGIVGQERVYEDLLVPGGYEPEGCMSEVGDPDSAEHVVHGLPPS